MGKKIIGIIGDKGGGKDTAIKYLESHHNAYALGVGDLLTQILELISLPPSRNNLSNLAEAIRSKFGENVFQNALLKTITQRSKNNPQQIAIVNGIRMPKEVEDLRRNGAKIWYITAPVEIRYERTKKRGQKSDDHTQTLQQFIEEEQLGTEKHIPQLGKLADYHIDNSGTEQDLINQIEKILHNSLWNFLDQSLTLIQPKNVPVNLSLLTVLTDPVKTPKPNYWQKPSGTITTTG